MPNPINPVTGRPWTDNEMAYFRLLGQNPALGGGDGSPADRYLRYVATPDPQTGVSPYIQGVDGIDTRGGIDWARFYADVDYRNAVLEEQRRDRALQAGVAAGQLPDGRNTLDSIKYAESIMSNPQNTALYEMRRRGYALGPDPGDTVAEYLNRTIGDEAPGGGGATNPPPAGGGNGGGGNGGGNQPPASGNKPPAMPAPKGNPSANVLPEDANPRLKGIREDAVKRGDYTQADMDRTRDVEKRVADNNGKVSPEEMAFIRSGIPDTPEGRKKFADLIAGRERQDTYGTAYYRNQGEDNDHFQARMKVMQLQEQLERNPLTLANAAQRKAMEAELRAARQNLTTIAATKNAMGGTGPVGQPAQSDLSRLTPEAARAFEAYDKARAGAGAPPAAPAAPAAAPRPAASGGGARPPAAARPPALTREAAEAFAAFDRQQEQNRQAQAFANSNSMSAGKPASSKPVPTPKPTPTPKATGTPAPTNYNKQQRAYIDAVAKSKGEKPKFGYDDGGYVDPGAYGGLGDAFNKWYKDTSERGGAPMDQKYALDKFAEAIRNVAELRDIATEVQNVAGSQGKKNDAMYSPEMRKKLQRVNQLLDIDIHQGTGYGSGLFDTSRIHGYPDANLSKDYDESGSDQSDYQKQRDAVDFMVKHIMGMDTGQDPTSEAYGDANRGMQRVIHAYMPKWYEEINNPTYGPGQAMPLKEGGGMVIGGAPHWIVDGLGNPVAAITEDSKPEAVKGHGNVEVIPLDPQRNAEYEAKKRAGKVDGEDDDYFYAFGGMKGLSGLKNLRLPGKTVAPAVKRPKRTTNAQSKKTVALPGGMKARTTGTTDRRVNNGKTNNGNVATPGQSKISPVGSSTDKDAMSILPVSKPTPVDRVSIPEQPGTGTGIRPLPVTAPGFPSGPVIGDPNRVSIPRPVGPITQVGGVSQAPSAGTAPPAPKPIFVGSGGNRTIDNRVGGARFGSDANAPYARGSMNIPGNPGVSVLQPWKYAPRTLNNLGDFGRAQLMSQMQAAGMPGTEFADRAMWAEPGAATTGRTFFRRGGYPRYARIAY